MKGDENYQKGNFDKKLGNVSDKEMESKGKVLGRQKWAEIGDRKWWCEK